MVTVGGQTVSLQGEDIFFGHFKSPVAGELDLALEWEAGRPGISLNTVPGRTYLLETSRDLSEWAPWAGGRFEGTGNRVELSPTPGENEENPFFRIVHRGLEIPSGK
ncbi:MAG: hypothetical protein ACP5I4_04265 [Oceanipulchritudo sp.]